MTEQRDPEAVDFERQVRHDATVHRIHSIQRMIKLKGSPATWWAVREMLRKRGEG